MTNLGLKYQIIFDKLMTRDVYEKQLALNDAFNLINDIEDENKKNDIRMSLLGVLVDMGRDKEWKECLSHLQKSNIYQHQICALFSIAQQYIKQKEDLKDVLATYLKILDLTRLHDDAQKQSEACLEIAKINISTSNFADSIEYLNQSISCATKIHNFNMIATATYYTALSMYNMGYRNIAMEKLRDASNIAREQRNPNIIKHTEIVRAKMLMDNGNFEIAQKTIDLWYNEFAMML